MLLGSSPSLEWEMDLAWVVKAGEDPINWMDKFGSRITAIHVKDIAPAGQLADEDGWADVGTGTLDWKSLLNDHPGKDEGEVFRGRARQAERRDPLRPPVDGLGQEVAVSQG